MGPAADLGNIVAKTQGLGGTRQGGGWTVEGEERTHGLPDLQRNEESGEGARRGRRNSGPPATPARQERLHGPSPPRLPQADGQAQFLAGSDQAPLRGLLFKFLRNTNGFAAGLDPADPRSAGFARLLALVMQRVMRGGQQKQVGGVGVG